MTSRNQKVFLLFVFGCLAWFAWVWHEVSSTTISHFRIDSEGQRIVRIPDSGEIPLVPEFLRLKPILLTIDDGPANTNVDLKMLAILNKHHAHAIWFITCKTLDAKIDPAAAEHREVLKKIRADGNVLGNHGYHHFNLKDMDDQGSALLEPEIFGCSRLIESVAGVRPKYFRPPFGQSTQRVDALIKSDGMQAVLWSINTQDSLLAKFKDHPDVYLDYVHNNPAFDVPGHAERGEILLMHDYPNTLQELDELLTKLEHAGFVFVLPQ